MNRPNKIMQLQTDGLRWLLVTMKIELPDGYEVFVTDTTRGRCSYKKKTITVAPWAFKNVSGPYKKFNKGDVRYREYYLAHECAHAITFEETGERNHRGDFMQNFIKLCPPELQKYELNYKPGLAKAAGI
jgi:hypothetical protein